MSLTTIAAPFTAFTLVVSTLPPQSPAARSSVASKVAMEVRAGYVLADRADQIAQEIERRLRSADLSGSKVEAAAAINRELRAASADLHLEVVVTPPQTGTPPSSMTAVLAAAQRQTAEANGGMRRAEVLDGNVGLLTVTSFQSSGLSRGALEAAMKFVARTDALLIDLRDNEGGDPGMVNLVCSYLTGPFPLRTNRLIDRQGRVIREYWTESVDDTAAYRDKPVLVLTSRRTISAGEELAYGLQAMKRARIVGEATAGGAHVTRPVVITPEFVLMLPFARSVNPTTNANWEGSGVTPDTAASESDALSVALRTVLKELASSAAPEVRASAAAALARLGK